MAPSKQLERRYMVISGTLVPGRGFELGPGRLTLAPRGLSASDDLITAEVFRDQQPLGRWRGQLIRRHAGMLSRDQELVGPARIRLKVPWPDGANRLVVRLRDEIVYERQAAKHPPVFDRRGVRVVKRKGVIFAEWSAKSQQALHYSVRLHRPDGSILRLATLVKATRLQIPPQALHGGAARLEVIATDGMQETNSIVALGMPAEVGLVLMLLTARRVAEHSVAFALHVQRHGTSLPDLSNVECHWIVDGKRVASGLRARWHAAPPGEYKLEVHVTAFGHNERLRTRLRI